MKISHTWYDSDSYGEIEPLRAWAEPSTREIAEYKRYKKENPDSDKPLLYFCNPPRGWDWDKNADDESDGAYLIKINP